MRLGHYYLGRMANIAQKSTGGKSLVMEQISVDKAKEIAKKKGLKPGRVKGTNGIQFTKGSNDRLEIIPWDEFEKSLKSRGLGVFESGGWMKIMKKG